MKLKFQQTISASQQQVWAAFEDPANPPRWQQNFESLTQKSGQRGQPDSVSELVFNEKDRKIVLTETITERREPDFFAATYESDFGKTLIVNHFEALGEQTTRWSSWCNVSFKGFMKVMSLFVASKIRKRTEGDMERFKLMVESDLANEQS